jgi:hypothetical protein
MSFSTIISTMLSQKSLCGSVDTTTTAKLLFAALLRPLVRLVLTLQPLLRT